MNPWRGCAPAGRPFALVLSIAMIRFRESHGLTQVPLEYLAIYTVASNCMVFLPGEYLPCEAPKPARRRAGWLWRIGAQDSRMLHRRIRQPPTSRYSDWALRTHLRELVAQSSHGRPTRSPTNFERHRLSTCRPDARRTHWQRVATASQYIRQATRAC